MPLVPKRAKRCQTTPTRAINPSAQNEPTRQNGSPHPPHLLCASVSLWHIPPAPAQHGATPRNKKPHFLPPAHNEARSHPYPFTRTYSRSIFPSFAVQK